MLVFLKGQRMIYIAHRLETLDPVTNKWIEVTPGSATVKFRESGGGADMPILGGVFTWPRNLTHAGAGTKRWYAEIDGKNLNPDPAKSYEAVVEGVDQDGAEFSAIEDLPVIDRTSLDV